MNSVAAPVPEQDRRIVRTRWHVLFAVSFCYAFYYTGRQNFGFAVHALQTECGYSASMIGITEGAMLMCYAVGQAVNGNLSDRLSPRYFMAAGAVCSVALNWIVSTTNNWWSLTLLWTANGWFQSFGWPAGVRMLANWWDRAERGRTMGWYVFSSGCSSLITYALCVPIAASMGWRWIFRLPVLTMLPAAAALLIGARDRPADGARPEPESAALQRPPGATAGSMRSRFLHALRNGPFLLACASISFQAAARYGLLYWIPVYFVSEHWRQGAAASKLALWLPAGMAIGAVVGGQASDRLFRGNRQRAGSSFLGLCAASAALLAFSPQASGLAVLALLFITGFAIYAPEPSFWALCPELLGEANAGTGTGLMDAAAYAGAACGQVLIGLAIDQFGISSTLFPIVAAQAFAASLLLRNAVRKAARSADWPKSFP